jgi:hypothetical protein
MIALVGASAMYLAALQASINAPREAFWACAKEQRGKAKDEKVTPDSFEAYLRNACSSQLQALRSAIAAVDLKNGMAAKAAAADARSSIDDYVSDPVNNYKFEAGADQPKAPAAAPAAAPPPKQADSQQAASPQPHRL